MPTLPPLIADHVQIAVLVAALILAALSMCILIFRRSPMGRLAARIGLFAALTAVLVNYGVEPYQPHPNAVVSAAGQIGLYFIEIIWWIALARCLVGVVDAFVISEVHAAFKDIVLGGAFAIG